MKGDMKPHTSQPSFFSTSSLNMRNESHVISNTKPKIRIIHVLAPEIIKTDASNFRQLVQRLTGMKGEEEPKKKIKALESNNYKAEETTESCNSGSRDKMKEEEEEERRGEENRKSFGDLDSLIRELIDDFPLVPLNSSCKDAFGESG